MAELLERPRAAGLDDASLDTAAIRGMVAIAKAWRLTVPQAASLIRESDRNWSRLKSNPGRGFLDTDQRTRVSALLGLYKGLHEFFGADLADRWVALPNRGPLFAGAAPLDFMIEGGIPAMLDVRDHADALGNGM